MSDRISEWRFQGRARAWHFRSQFQNKAMRKLANCYRVLIVNIAEEIRSMVWNHITDGISIRSILKIKPFSARTNRHKVYSDYFETPAESGELIRNG